VTRVRKAAAVSLMTPMVAAAIAVGLGQSAHAAEVCPPLASASIKAPTETVTAGSRTHVSAQINGLMLLQAHLQISGPGLDEQVGKSAASGTIQGDVTVPQAGYFTLAVIGNGTSCTYQTAGFSVKERATVAKPTHSSAPSGTPHPSGGSSRPRGAGAIPGGNAGNAGKAGSGATGGGNYTLNPLNGASPFSLPSVAPDGSSLKFEYPSPDPQVASPPSRPMAHNISETTPIKWGQSLAIALVLLIISAHLGMWSRRQRLAAEGAPTTRGGRRGSREKAHEASAMMAATGVLTDGTTAATGGSGAAEATKAPGAMAEATKIPGAAATPGVRKAADAADDSNPTEAFATSEASERAVEIPGEADDAASALPRHRTRSSRGYHGRRRRS
jgi:hypothetical protein